MGKRRILVFSILFILGCGMCVATNDDNLKRQKLSWSRKAGLEAENVAAISCSGHGHVYLDGLVDKNGEPFCECHPCYEGPNCSQFITNCSANAAIGDPLFLEPFWMKRARSSAVVVSGWHRMSYDFPDQTYISQQLEIQIRKLHSIAKNAVTEGKYIIFGAGSTQLINAAVFALSMNNGSSPARVAADPPFYPVYKSQIDYFETSRFRFDETLLPSNSSNNNGGKVIEFVCSPNNPDGYLKKNVLQGPSVSTIYDHAYYWPHYTPIPAPSDQDLMIFTLSKFTGHAGSRFGWALVKDKTVYDNMVYYMEMASMGTSRDTQLRVHQLFNTILQTNGKEIFDFAYNSMRRRWDKLNNIISSSNGRFTLQKIPPQFCTYFNQVRDFTPAYAWVKCERDEDSDCAKVFEEAKITGRGGRVYHADESYVRFALIRGNDDFNLLLQRLVELVSKET